MPSARTTCALNPPWVRAPAFVIDLCEELGQRFVCGAFDALEIAPLLGRRVRLWSQCRHCAGRMDLRVDAPGVKRADVSGRPDRRE
jgi:hypothetical protein